MVTWVTGLPLTNVFELGEIFIPLNENKAKTNVPMI